MDVQQVIRDEPNRFLRGHPLLIVEAPEIDRAREGPQRALTAIGDRLGIKRAEAATPPTTWIAPGVSFLAWQLVVRLATGSWPLLTSGQRNLGAPFAGLAQGFGHYVDRSPSTAAALWFGELFVLVVVVVGAALALRYDDRSPVRASDMACLRGVALILAPGIWLGDVGFRSLDDLYVFSCIVLLVSKQRLTIPVVLVAGGWLVVAVELVRFV